MVQTTRASTRVSIAFDGEAPREDTDTLVLTFSCLRSLDLRVSRDDPTKLDWATASSVTELPGGTADHPRLRWDTILNSRPPSDLPDEGDFETLPSGDVLEKGVMRNPATDRDEMYQEIWRRLPIATGEEVLLLQSASGSLGFAGRVGPHALAITGQLADCAAWREELIEGKWQRSYDIGKTQSLPSLPVDTPAEWQSGATVSHGNSEWVVLQRDAMR